MTPNEKNKFKDNSQCRSLELVKSVGDKLIDTDYYVEGYAARFEPYVLYEEADETKIYERFDKNCFDNCDMSDIILQYDHSGRVYARTSNGSLIVKVDDVGLFIAADLGRTEEARKLYEDIKQGMVTKMSWRFSCGEYEFVEDTIVHHTVKKCYDVSAVSIPANDSTEISARSFANGVISEKARRDAEREEMRAKMQIKLKLMELRK